MCGCTMDGNQRKTYPGGHPEQGTVPVYAQQYQYHQPTTASYPRFANMGWVNAHMQGYAASHGASSSSNQTRPPNYYVYAYPYAGFSGLALDAQSPYFAAPPTSESPWNLQQKSESLSLELEDVHGKISSLESTNRQIQKKISRLESDVGRVRDQMGKLVKLPSDQLQHETDRLREERREMELARDQLQDETNRLRDQMSELELSRDQLQHETDRLKDQMCEMELGRDRLQQETNRLHAQAGELQTTRDQLQHETDRLREQMHEIELARDQLQHHTNRLHDQMGELELSRDQLQHETDRLREQMREMELGRDRLQQETNRLHARTGELQLTRDQLQHETDRLRDQMCKMESGRDQLQHETNRLHDKRGKLQSTRDQLQHQADRLREQMHELGLARDQLQHETNRLHDIRYYLQFMRDQLQHQTDRLREEILELESGRDRLRHETNRLCDEKGKLEFVRNVLQGEAGRMRSENLQLWGEYGTFELESYPFKNSDSEFESESAISSRENALIHGVEPSPTGQSTRSERGKSGAATNALSSASLSPTPKIDLSNTNNLSSKEGDLNEADEVQRIGHPAAAQHHEANGGQLMSESASIHGTLMQDNGTRYATLPGHDMPHFGSFMEMVMEPGYTSSISGEDVGASDPCSMVPAVNKGKSKRKKRRSKKHEPTEADRLSEQDDRKTADQIPAGDPFTTNNYPQPTDSTSEPEQSGPTHECSKMEDYSSRASNPAASRDEASEAEEQCLDSLLAESEDIEEKFEREMLEFLYLILKLKAAKDK